MKAKYATALKYYTFEGTRYLCFWASPGADQSTGFVCKCGQVEWLYDDRIQELPPECDSFDWKPDPYVKLKEMIAQLEEAVDIWDETNNQTKLANYDRGYYYGLQFALHIQQPTPVKQ